MIYDLRIKNLLRVPKVNASSYGQMSLSFRGTVLWNTLPVKHHNIGTKYKIF